MLAHRPATFSRVRFGRQRARSILERERAPQTSRPPIQRSESRASIQTGPGRSQVFATAKQIFAEAARYAELTLLRGPYLACPLQYEHRVLYTRRRRAMDGVTQGDTRQAGTHLRHTEPRVTTRSNPVDVEVNLPDTSVDTAC